MKSSSGAVCITLFVSILLAYYEGLLDVSYKLDQAAGSAARCQLQITHTFTLI
jgi:hypothetical protein